jgi:hypothetical protein
MAKFLLPVTVGILILASAPAIYPQSVFRPSAADSEAASAVLPDIPRLPPGKTTIFGGAIRSFDPVRDQFTLDVVGQRPMHVLFDERTQVFRDGSKIPLRELGPEEHASVETTLDGDNVFAVSIHILSRPAEGQYEGRVVSYAPNTGALFVDASSSRDPLKVFISNNTQFLRAGQRQFASVPSGPRDLAQGSLVSITFQSREPGHAVARAITVLAVPGSTFSFNGSVASIDLHSGSLVLVDANDQKTYQISFNAVLFPESRTLHPGDHVLITATYNRTGFVATTIAAN